MEDRSACRAMKMRWGTKYLILLLLLDALYLFYLPRQKIKGESPEPARVRLSFTEKDSKNWWIWESAEKKAGLPAGVWRYGRNAPPPIALPQVVAVKDFPPERVVQHADLKGQGRKPLLLSATDRDLCLLLDVSATMGESQGGRQSPSKLAVAIRSLSQRRTEDSRNWKLYTFASDCRFAGRWTPDGTLPPSLPSPGGRTELVPALNMLGRELNSPHDMVIVTDGEVTERDRDSVGGALGNLWEKGHRIFVLDPSLSSTSRFARLASEGKTLHRWPDDTPSPAPEDSRVLLPDGRRIEWKGTLTCAPARGMVTLARAENGRAVVFLDGQNLHLVGSPALPASEVAALYRRDWKAPVISLTPQKLMIDFGENELSILELQWEGGNRSLAPELPGIYELEWKDGALPSSLTYSHESGGSGTVTGLNLAPSLFPDPKPAREESNWSVFSAANNAKSFAVLLLFLHIIVFVFLLKKPSVHS